MKMMKNFGILFPVVLSILTLSCSNTPVRIEGRITRGESNQPIAGAWVYDPSIKVAKATDEDTVKTPLAELSDDPKITRTDSLGYFALEHVPQRRHFIYFAARDHEPVKFDFNPRMRTNTYIINVELEPSPIEVGY